jgi:hypothetical protein
VVPCNHTGLIVLGFINCNTNAFQSLTQLHGKFLIFVAAANKEEWLIFFFGGIIFLTVDLWMWVCFAIAFLLQKIQF